MVNRSYSRGHVMRGFIMRGFSVMRGFRSSVMRGLLDFHFIYESFWDFISFPACDWSKNPLITEHVQMSPNDALDFYTPSTR